MSNEIKYIGKCPACGRGIEHGDDVVEQNGVMYHEGCEPPLTASAPPTKSEVVLSQPESLAVQSTPTKSEGGKKVSKKSQEIELIEKMLAALSVLTNKVAELEARPLTAVSAREAAPKKSKAEKGAPRPDVYYVIKGYASEGRPPQFLKVSRALAQAAPENGKLTEMEVWNALMDGPHPSEKPNKSVGSWSYRQTPFYIFKYYRAQMLSAEYVLGPFNL